MTDHKSLSVADLKDIQAGPVVDVPARNSTYLFFSIKDVEQFRILFGEHVLPHITTSDSARGTRVQVYRAKAVSSLNMVTLAAINVSFSQQGLDLLLPDANISDDAFSQGQFQRAESLGDDKTKWLPQFTGTPIHGLFEVTGYPAFHIQEIVDRIIKKHLCDTAIKIIFEHHAKVRPGKEKGHEHFGFNDGISQPFVRFEDDDKQQRKELPGQTVVNPGVLVLGQPGDASQLKRPSWAKNGSFLVYRHLQQLVPEFNSFVKDAVLRSIFDPPGLPNLAEVEDIEQVLFNGELAKRIDFLGARLVGRWKSGLPVVLTPMQDGKIPVDDPTKGTNPQLNNNFDYGPRGVNPRSQFLCPFAGHTRKTGPRTDVTQAIVEQHAILRSGIAFGPELSEQEVEENKTLLERGLSFICYQSSLETGFEFIQKTWSNNVNFTANTNGVAPGFDPIIGQKQGQARQMTGYDAENLSKELQIPDQFVVAQGGEYFFLPSITTLKEISTCS